MEDDDKDEKLPNPREEATNGVDEIIRTAKHHAKEIISQSEKRALKSLTSLHASLG